MRELFVKAGFAPQDQVAGEGAANSILNKIIDDYHVMYGRLYIKEQ
jgi:hypothetical protein